MAYISQATAHEVDKIKIIETKGHTVDWYTIYLDDTHLCSVFGINKKLPEIITPSEQQDFNPPSEKDTENA